MHSMWDYFPGTLAIGVDMDKTDDGHNHYPFPLARYADPCLSVQVGEALPLLYPSHSFLPLICLVL